MTYEPDCDRPIPASTLREGAAIWLLSVVVAGRTLRWSSRPCEAGGFRWRGGLPSVRVNQVLDLLQQDPVAPSVSVGLVVTEDIAEWVSYGHRLTGEAELSLWVEGTDIEERQVLVRGPLLAGSYGGVGEPITATIEPTPQGEGDPIDGTVQIYGAESVADVVRYERSEGEEYPLVFGTPYAERRRAGATGRSRPYATKAVVWARDGSFPERVRQILLCRGHVPDGESITVAWEGTADPADEGTASIDGAFIVRTVDVAGRPVTYADVDLAGLTIAQREAATWWVRWDECSGGTTKSAGGIETVTRRYTGADTPIDETLTIARAGDVVIRAQAVVETSFSSSPTLDLDLARGTVPIELLDLSGSDLTTTGTRTGAENIRVRSSGAVRLQATGASGEALVRLDIRRVPPPGDSIRTLGELMLWLVERSNQRTDYAAWNAMLPLLDVPVGGQLDPSKPAWKALLEDVLPLAPVSLRTGPAGVVPVLWRWWATDAESEARLRVGYDGIVRLPDVRSARPDSEVNTSVLARYGWDARANNYAFALLLTGERAPRDTIAGARRSVISTLDATVARQTYGVRTLRVDSRLVYSTATAAWWARWRLAAEGWAHRLVAIEGGQQLASLMPGAVVALTDPTVYLDGAVALVLGRELSDVGRVTLRLALRDGWSGIRTTSPNGDTGTPIRNGGPDPRQN